MTTALLSKAAFRVIALAVNKKATKQQIKGEFEKLYEVKVGKITVVNTHKGTKRAFIKLKPEFKAVDLATKLKIM